MKREEFDALFWVAFSVSIGGYVLFVSGAIVHFALKYW